ncbi:unnamed protein product, partial [Rotaria sordida]
MKQLARGDFFSLYFHTHNAAILVEMDKSRVSRPLVSSWEVLLSSAEITSNLLPRLVCFPLSQYYLQNLSQLSSKAQCELLIDFMNNTLEHNQSYKSSRAFDETRDVPVSLYVCHWWITQFQKVKIENPIKPYVQFTKKHRDQVRWDKALLPFRRSGLWMTMKVVFQTILIKNLGNFGNIVYKLLITYFLTYVIYTRQKSIDSKINVDLLIHCLRKIVRRLNKIDNSSLIIDSDTVKEWIENTKRNIEQQLYQTTALKHYYSKDSSIDPIGYTRFILTSLTVIRLMHQKLCADQRFERLRFHSIEIPHLIELFDYLLLPTRNDMIRARQLYNFFREYSQKQYPDLLGNIELSNAFGIHFANQSETMNESLNQIRAQAERDKQTKIKEVNNEKERYAQLMEEANKLTCECVFGTYLTGRGVRTYVKEKCVRCKTIEKAGNIKVDIYECPIPTRQESALAVIFGLQMPIEIRCYREILWQFINRPNPQPDNS